jgi:hypothetical protein
MLLPPRTVAAAPRAAHAEAGAPIPRPRTIRPSVLEPLLKSEPWIGACCCYPHVLVLYVEGRPVSLIQSTPLDLPALESRLFHLRSHNPRQSAVSAPRRKPRRPARS